MNLTRSLLLALALTAAPLMPSLAADGAADALALLDKTTASGYLTLQVSHHAAPSPKGKPGAVRTYQATLLFDRPDLFRYVLNPGKSNEFRAVGDGDQVRWLDLATGASGKGEAAKLAEPVALALLGTAGELGRLATVRPVGLGKDNKLSGARVVPQVYGSRVRLATAWFHQGQPVGFDFEMHDGTRTFVAVLGFQPNVQTAPKDFEL
ncbi:hypothetical protein [Arenimonas sp. MALMAid1274]|uniref:hypothetical protein n=1 Tax=Arenimonas sp. MALMAid1274 TaxID=3411630 RepID=UPI003BA2F5BF